MADYIAEAITAQWGERCPEFAEGCARCEAWRQYDRLREALEPFAKACSEYFNDTCPDETPAWYYEDPEEDTWGNSLPSKVTVGDFRRARSLRESLQTAEGEKP